MAIESGMSLTDLIAKNKDWALLLGVSKAGELPLICDIMENVLVKAAEAHDEDGTLKYLGYYRMALDELISQPAGAEEEKKDRFERTWADWVRLLYDRLPALRVVPRRTRDTDTDRLPTLLKVKAEIVGVVMKRWATTPHPGEALVLMAFLSELTPEFKEECVALAKATRDAVESVHPLRASEGMEYLLQSATALDQSTWRGELVATLLRKTAQHPEGHHLLACVLGQAKPLVSAVEVANVAKVAPASIETEVLDWLGNAFERSANLYWLALDLRASLKGKSTGDDYISGAIHFEFNYVGDGMEVVIVYPESNTEGWLRNELRKAEKIARTWLSIASPDLTSLTIDLNTWDEGHSSRVWKQSVTVR
ncbi:MAG: hypothetical protein AAB590_01550 [Patescibacteria group bacterium]